MGNLLDLPEDTLRDVRKIAVTFAATGKPLWAMPKLVRVYEAVESHCGGDAYAKAKLTPNFLVLKRHPVTLQFVLGAYLSREVEMPNVRLKSLHVHKRLLNQRPHLDLLEGVYVRNDINDFCRWYVDVWRINQSYRAICEDVEQWNIAYRATLGPVCSADLDVPPDVSVDEKNNRLFAGPMSWSTVCEGVELPVDVPSVRVVGNMLTFRLRDGSEVSMDYSDDEVVTCTIRMKNR